MQHATCNMQHATCNMPQTAYNKTTYTYTIHHTPELELCPHAGAHFLCTWRMLHEACMLHVARSCCMMLVARCMLYAARCTLHDTWCAVACLRVAPVRAIIGNGPTLTPHDAARGNTYLQPHDVSNVTRWEGLQGAATSTVAARLRSCPIGCRALSAQRSQSVNARESPQPIGTAPTVTHRSSAVG